LNYSANIILWWFSFQDRVLRTICQGWLQTMVLLISASWVVRITEVRYQQLAWASFFVCLFACLLVCFGLFYLFGLLFSWLGSFVLFWSWTQKITASSKEELYNSRLNCTSILNKTYSYLLSSMYTKKVLCKHFKDCWISL
jgi:hypothetical protein